MAKKPLVKCPICGQSFDRDLEPFEQIGRRYYHKKCCESSSASYVQELKAKEDFYQYIKQLYGPEYNFIAISKQAEKYINQYQFTYSGMLKSLKWYYEKEGHDISKSNGSIGIIPYIYKQAKLYYYALYQAQLVNAQKDATQYLESPVREITIESPRVFVPSPHLWLEEDEDE